MELQWWHWAVAGMILVLMELGVGSFVLVWFGLGALVVAAVVFVAPGMGETPTMVLWTAVSLILVVLWFRLFKPGLHKTRQGMSDADVVGEVGLLLKDVAPFQRGSVRFQKPVMGAETWECISDESIAGGERVRVLAVEGQIFKVARERARDAGIGVPD